MIICALRSVHVELFKIGSDYENAQAEIARLHRELYEPIVHAQEPRAPFPLLTNECFAQNKVDAVEAEIHAACQGTAVGLWKTIRIQEALGYVAARNRTASDIYDLVEERFGKLPYNKRNFRDARSKK